MERDNDKLEQILLSDWQRVTVELEKLRNQELEDDIPFPSRWNLDFWLSTRKSAELQLLETRELLHKVRYQQFQIDDFIQDIDEIATGLDGMEDLEYLLSVRKIVSPPANGLVSLLKFIYTKKSFEHIFAQTIADMREEYYEALEANNKSLARWRHVQLHLSLSSTVIAWVGASTLKKLFAMWKAI